MRIFLGLVTSLVCR